MIMAISTVVILSLIAASVLWAVLFGGQLPKPYFNRTYQGKGWRNAFPTSSKQDIREFLSVFVDAFAFSQAERLKLNPDDQVLQIYRTIYPSKWTPDTLEIETLAKDIEAKYGFSLESIWHEPLTLGELFQVTEMARTS
jgi:propanediol dehydratase small subunit